MTKTIRAFFGALWLTLRGKQAPPPLRFARLREWLSTAQQRAAEVRRAARSGGVDLAGVTLRLEGREVNMATVIDAVAHHVDQEYPYMLQHLTEHTITGIYASNLNDRYMVRQFVQADTLADPATRQAVAALADHLDAIPPSNALD